VEQGKEYGPGGEAMPEDADTVVLDIEMVATLLAGLNEQRDLFHALQFVTLAEAVVLRDSLVVVSVSDGSPETDAERAEERVLVEEMMSPLIDAGSIRIEDLRLTPGSDVPDYMSVDRPNVTVIAAEDDVIANVALMAGRSLTIERLRNTPSTTLPMQQTFYEMSANVRGDHSICNLSTHYASVSRALQALREGMQIDTSDYEVIPLPPIGLELFRAASSVEQLPTELVNLRERYQDLRFRLRQLKEMRADQSISLRRKATYSQKWMRAWEGLHTRYEFNGAVGLANTNSAIYKLAPEVPGVMGFDPRSWINLLKAAVEEGPELWSRWRLRTMHRTLKAYVKAPDRELGEAVERITKRPVTDDDVRDVREVQDMMAELAASAVVVYRDDDTIADSD
jgi:hypothetical protein